MKKEELRLKALELVAQANSSSGQLLPASYLIQQAEAVAEWIEHGPQRKIEQES